MLLKKQKLLTVDSCSSSSNPKLAFDKQIEALAEDFVDKHNTLFLGRGEYYPIAMEAALKLKEISYIHAGSYAAGELKTHGPLALLMQICLLWLSRQTMIYWKAKIER